MPWTWNTCLARSKPIVVTCMWTAPHVIRLTTITLRHFGAGERAPSTTSTADDCVFSGGGATLYITEAPAGRMRSIGSGGALHRRNRKQNPMPIDEFHERSRAAWDAAVARISGPGAAATIVWRGRQEIIQALAPFMGQNCNHAHLPTGGGLDFLSIGPSVEPGCLEFMSDRVVQIMKPRSLTLERIDSAGNSFLLFELDDLNPSGVYEADKNEMDGDNDADRADLSSEELLELAPAYYVSRDVWNRGFLDHDDGVRP